MAINVNFADLSRWFIIIDQVTKYSLTFNLVENKLFFYSKFVIDLLCNPSLSKQIAYDFPHNELNDAIHSLFYNVRHDVCG